MGKHRQATIKPTTARPALVTRSVPTDIVLFDCTILASSLCTIGYCCRMLSSQPNLFSGFTLRICSICTAFVLAPALGAVMVASRRSAAFSLCVEPERTAMTPKLIVSITAKAINRIIGLLPL